MKLVFASDSFKGSLTSERIAELLKDVAEEVFPEAVTEGIAVADGGEGTVDTVVKSVRGSYRTAEVIGPLGEPLKAEYGLLPNGSAMIEMAAASGLPLVPEGKRNPMKTTSLGTGMLIKDALEQGVRNITIAIGGSATNDGGMGAMSALGVKFFDAGGNVLRGCGEDLQKVKTIDISGLHPAVKESSFTVMCDVTNPLLGNDGATFTFGRQKGAGDIMLDLLESGMTNYSKIVERTLGVYAADNKGAGAAGGLGFALMAFLGAELKPGIETVLDIIGFDEKIQDADLVITGEGRMDWQSSMGKVPSGIGRRCRKRGIPVVAVTGGLLRGYEKIYENGICSVITTVNGVMDLKEAVENSEALYKDAAYRLLSAVKCGMQLQEKKSHN